MTIQRDGREQYLECEECPETTDSYEAETRFDEMIAEAKAKGWKIRYVNGEWLHTCPDCKAGDRLAAARAKFR